MTFEQQEFDGVAPEIVSLEDKKPTQPESPADFALKIISAGGNVEILKELLAIQKEWEAHQAEKAFARDMAELKKIPLKISKNKKADFDTKGGGRMQYSYASLGEVANKVNAALADFGFSASYIPDTSVPGRIKVTCVLTHKLGHKEMRTLEAPHDNTGLKNAIQAQGSAATYLQRYTLLMATGFAVDDMENDGATVAEFISDTEVENISIQLEELKVDQAAFLKFMKVEKISDILKSDYTKAVNMLSAKRAKK